MVRKMWRDTESNTWGVGKGLWAKSGSSFVEAKKAWGNVDGVWTQFWPPDLPITFNVVATTGEVGYTTSNLTWSMDTGVSGTITIQRKSPGGAYVDWLTGQAKTGSASNQLLAPYRGAAGTWSYRAAFIPTNDTTRSYSAEDTVSLTVPSVSFTLTETTGEVYYTNGAFTWATTSNLSGEIQVQRKQGVGGTWTTFYTTPTLNITNRLIQLTPAGTGLNTTWYYRAAFIPTVDNGWFIYSSEDSATLSYRSIGSAPSNIEPWWIDTYSDMDEWNLWPIRGPINTVEIASIQIPVGSYGTMPYLDLDHINVVFNGDDGYYTWMSGGVVAYSQAQDQGGFAFTCGRTYSEGTEGRRFNHQSNTTYASLVGGWRTLTLPGVSSPTWGTGFNLINSDGNGSAQFVFKDGQSHTVAIVPQLAVG